jgi:hypothetical protein
MALMVLMAMILLMYSGRESILAEVSQTLVFDFLVDDHDRSFGMPLRHRVPR